MYKAILVKTFSFEQDKTIILTKRIDLPFVPYKKLIFYDSKIGEEKIIEVLWDNNKQLFEVLLDTTYVNKEQLERFLFNGWNIDFDDIDKINEIFEGKYYLKRSDDFGR